MLNAPDGEDRRLAARICGQEKYGDIVPKLRDLLKDPAYHLDGARNRIYFVRKEAVSALKALGEKVGNVVLEEPDPERHKAKAGD